MSASPRRVVLLVRSLGRGGAERQVVHAARGLHERGWRVTVIAFYGGEALDSELIAAGIRLIALGKRGRRDVLAFFVRLAAALRRERPDVIYSVLDVPNVVGALVLPFTRGGALVWGVRGSQREREHYDRLHALTLVLERVLARRASAVIVNSQAGAEHVRERKWPVQSAALVVVPNGIDTPPDPHDAAARDRLRHEWDVQVDAVLLCIVGRLDPVKGHRLFLQSAALASKSSPSARFVVVGSGPTAERETLMELARSLGIDSRVIWAGQRSDMHDVYAAIDVLVSASTSEGFSNAVAEAMAAAVVPVVTDVGDSAILVGDAGSVVPAADPNRLAAAMIEVCNLAPAERRALGAKARERVLARYGVDVMVQRTEEVLLRAAGEV